MKLHLVLGFPPSLLASIIIVMVNEQVLFSFFQVAVDWASPHAKVFFLLRNAAANRDHTISWVTDL